MKYSNNDALARIMEQQNQLLERLDVQSVPVREPQITDIRWKYRRMKTTRLRHDTRQRIK